MKKISVDDKRMLDGEFTKQLLNNTAIRDELMRFTNAFIRNFDSDPYRLFHSPTQPGLPISELCSLSVKGGLGIENLNAHMRQPAPDILVWNDYHGDCDLNLLIKRDHYPEGRTTGEVMAAVAQRIKILLAQTIAQTRYSTLVQDLRRTPPQPPLYFCERLEAISRLITFIAPDTSLPIRNTDLQPGATIDMMPIAKLFGTIIPGLVEVYGPDLQKVFDLITAGKANSFMVYCDVARRKFFVSNLEYARSTWTDIDYSFFPYAPGRVATLGFEISELAQQQIVARQVERESLPYDIFKVTQTPFSYTSQDLTNDPLNPRNIEIFTADSLQIRKPEDPSGSSYNLSLYANNLIDDFDLIRAAILFPGLFVTSPDPQAHPGADLTAQVSHGSAKCEFVDVAIPRIGAPEWFYLQDRTYYFQVPQNPAPNQVTFKICNWEYQAEENLNLLIEADAGASHSAHKQRKRVDRLCESWMNCDMAQVFPRSGGGAPPPGIPNFSAPAILVANFAEDYKRLYGLPQLSDDLYNLVFERLFRLSDALVVYRALPGSDQPNLDRDTELAIDNVRKAAGTLGRTGLRDLKCMADVVDGPIVATLRALVAQNAIKVNWVLASYLLLKASVVTDVIWFPEQALFEVTNPGAVAAELPAFAAMAAGDFGLVNWTDIPGQYVLITPFPAAAIVDQVPTLPYSGELLLAMRPLIRDVNDNLLHANNQMLRIAYGQILNALMEANAQSYMGDIIPL